MHNGIDMDKGRRKLRTEHNTKTRTQIGAQKGIELKPVTKLYMDGFNKRTYDLLPN